MVGLGEVETAVVVINLGFATHLAGDAALAASRFLEGLELGRRLGDPEALALAVLGLALTSPDQETAATLHGEFDALQSRFRFALDPIEAQLRNDDHGRLQSTLGSEAFECAHAAGRNYGRDEVVSIALSSSLKHHPTLGAPVPARALES